MKTKMLEETTGESPVRRTSSNDSTSSKGSSNSLEERVAYLELEVSSLREKSKRDDAWKALISDWIFQDQDEKLKVFKQRLMELGALSQPSAGREAKGLPRVAKAVPLRAAKVGANLNVNGKRFERFRVAEDLTAARKRTREETSLNLSINGRKTSPDRASSTDSKNENITKRFANGKPEDGDELDYGDEQEQMIECSPDLGDMVHISQDEESDTNSQHDHNATALYDSLNLKTEEDEDYEEYGSGPSDSNGEVQGDENTPVFKRFLKNSRELYSPIPAIKKEYNEVSLLKPSIRTMGRSRSLKTAHEVRSTELPEFTTYNPSSDNGADDYQFGSLSTKSSAVLKPFRAKTGLAKNDYITEKKPNFLLRKGLEDWYDYIGHRVMDDAAVAQDSRYIRNGQRSFKVQCKKCNCVLSGHDSTNSNLWTHLQSAHGYYRQAPRANATATSRTLKLDNTTTIQLDRHTVRQLSVPLSTFLSQPHFLLANANDLMRRSETATKS